MDKNIAALLREDAKTILVHFSASTWEKNMAKGNGREVDNRAYTYVTHLEVAPGDSVIVDASNILKVATVVEVHAGVNIQPNADIKYKWVLMKVDMAPAIANEARNDEIEAVVSEAYKANLRRSFAQQILSGVLPEQQLKLESLLK